MRLRKFFYGLFRNPRLFRAGKLKVFTVTTADFILASEFIQQWETGLRAGDALHLAIARNHSIENFLSLDRKLIDAARQLKIPSDSAGLLED